MQFLSVFVLLFSVASLQGQGIEFFKGSWEEALVMAKQEDKPIFVDAYASWCGPCKQMSANVFPLPEVGEVFNGNFISLKLDMEKPEAASFRANHPVRAYPTLFFLDAAGETIHTVVGGQKASGLIDHARKALGKTDPLEDYEKRYLAGDRDPDLVFRYVRALVRQGQPHLKIANDQLRDQAGELDAPGNLRLMMLAATEADSRVFDLLLQHRSLAEALVSPEALKKQVALAFNNTKAKAVEFNNPKLLEDAAKKYKSFDPQKANELLLSGQLALAAKGTDAKAFYKAANKYYKKVATADKKSLAPLFDQLSTSSFTKDAKVQALGKQVGTEAAEASQDYQAYFKLAKWLQQQGDKAAALSAAQKAKGLVPENDANVHRLLDYLIKEIGGV